ncbi:fructose-bisphosphate aldolase [Gordonia sihwensis]|uniref:glycoside hydrolase family 76 protein n=1 Tax=Gordonia sihwensis TaxID=173559 RepID=UPI001C92EE79|nr:glycoside hydrolase family 76 protein [Gordonia sihwensis]MBY4570035.1 fructose-bisphosphate aldolase [Gordonia sihwensis]
MSPDSKSAEVQAQDRAAAAQSAIAARHLRRVGGWLPFTRIGRVAWPMPGRPLSRERLTASWNYWWQAHLVDLLVDGAVHREDRRCADDAAALLRGIWVRNVAHWTNAYYDDMAWLGLALERAGRHLHDTAGASHRRALHTLRDRMHDAWSPELGGGIPWRTTDSFFNTPANGPAAILLARTGRPDRAVEMADWIERELRLPAGLIADGVWSRPDGTRELDSTVFTYCQGVALGAETEAFRLTGSPVHLDCIDRILRAVGDRMTVDGVIRGAGGGDGGLFAGILARYLALVATDLPREAAGAGELRSAAAGLVLTAAQAAWDNRATDPQGLPVFGPDWHRPARLPDATGAAAQRIGGAVKSSSVPERDLSVQISAGILLEAAVSVTIGSSEHTGSATPD